MQRRGRRRGRGHSNSVAHCLLPLLPRVYSYRKRSRRRAQSSSRSHTPTHTPTAAAAAERSGGASRCRNRSGNWQVGGVVGRGGGGSSLSAASHMLYVARDNVRGRGCRTRAKTERFLGAFVRSTGGVACAAIAVMSGSAFFFFSLRLREYLERSTCGTVAGSRADQAGGGWMDGWTDQTGWLARPPVFKLNSGPPGIYYWLPLLTPMQISSNNEAVMLCASASVN